MLFGHQNDDTNQSDQTADANGVNPLAVDPDTGVSLPTAPEGLEHDGVEDNSAPDPVVSASPAFTDVTTPADDVAPAAPVDEPAATPTASSPSDDLLQPAGADDLLSLKQEALQQLSPLVGHLDQSPEEKFRTTMMLIQSSDNQALIKDAYEAAQAIQDDKVRAQALLDVVNEINYFTQHENN